MVGEVIGADQLSLAAHFYPFQPPIEPCRERRTVVIEGVRARFIFENDFMGRSGEMPIADARWIEDAGPQRVLVLDSISVQVGRRVNHPAVSSEIESSTSTRWGPA